MHRRRYGVAIAALAIAVSCRPGAGDRSEVPSPRPGPDTAEATPAANDEMSGPRAVHRATLLPDGRVLLTGGCSTAGCGGAAAGALAEVRRPDGSVVTVGRMHGSRLSHTATLLPNGEVLVAGGYPGEGAPPTDSLEVFDPRTGTFRVVGRLNEARADHSTSLLPDGRVLVAGGTDAGGQALRSTEVVDPSTGAVSQGSTLPRPRSAHVVTDLGGDPLVVGGSADGIRAVRATFRYDVAAERWRSGPDLKRPRVKCAAVTLPDGTVLVLGGSGDVEGRSRYRSTEILRAGSDRFLPGPTLAEPRYKIADAVALLQDGRLVVAGGTRPEVLDRRGRSFRTLPSTLGGQWSFQTATALAGGEVFVAGGYDDSITPTARTWLVNAG